MPTITYKGYIPPPSPAQAKQMIQLQKAWDKQQQGEPPEEDVGNCQHSFLLPAVRKRPSQIPKDSYL